MLYSAKDFLIIYNPYFTVINISENELILKSNNTGHFWKIYKTPAAYFQIEHKHRESDKFHIHSACVSLYDCFLEITNHDDYQLRNRKPAKFAVHSFFDEIMEIYSQE